MKLTPYYNGVPLYEKNGKIGVLISPGYGAGWSTWHDRRIAYDARVIKFWLEHKDEGECDVPMWDKFFEELGYDDVYMGAYDDLTLEFVPRHAPFFIEEYDGSETLQFMSEYNWICFD